MAGTMGCFPHSFIHFRSSAAEISTGRNSILFVLNMTPVKREKYRVAVPKNTKYKLILNSDEERFGGWGNEIQPEIMAEKKPFHYHDYSFTMDLPPYGAVVFVF